MLYIGLMSGTSMDAIDVAIADIDQHDLQVIAYEQFAFPESIQQSVRALNADSSINTVTELDVKLARLFADAILRALANNDLKAGDIAAVGHHGQTVLHLPDPPCPRTLQIGDGNIVAALTGIPVVSDFRRMDMALGGQGAPLAPAFHAWFFKSRNQDLAILNIGGMANLTVLTEEGVRGFDSGPGNALLDDWVRQHKSLDYDEDGLWAASGTVHEVLLQAMLADSYFAKNPPKSTGKDEFNLSWLEHLLSGLDNRPAVEDVQATLLQLSALTISDAVIRYADSVSEVVACGGGCHNESLMAKIQEGLQGRMLSTTAKYGMDPDAVEALAFAWLARQRLEMQAGNLPEVTGASDKVMLGALYQALKR